MLPLVLTIAMRFAITFGRRHGVDDRLQDRLDFVLHSVHGDGDLFVSTLTDTPNEDDTQWRSAAEGEGQGDGERQGNATGFEPSPAGITLTPEIELCSAGDDGPLEGVWAAPVPIPTVGTHAARPERTRTWRRLCWRTSRL